MNSRFLQSPNNLVRFDKSVIGIKRAVGHGSHQEKGNWFSGPPPSLSHTQTLSLFCSLSLSLSLCHFESIFVYLSVTFSVTHKHYLSFTLSLNDTHIGNPSTHSPISLSWMKPCDWKQMEIWRMVLNLLIKVNLFIVMSWRVDKSMTWKTDSQLSFMGRQIDLLSNWAQSFCRNYSISDQVNETLSR